MYEVSILGASLFQSVQYKFLKRKKKVKIKTDQSQMTVVIKEKKIVRIQITLHCQSSGYISKKYHIALECWSDKTSWRYTERHASVNNKENNHIQEEMLSILCLGYVLDARQKHSYFNSSVDCLKCTSTALFPPPTMSTQAKQQKQQHLAHICGIHSKSCFSFHHIKQYTVELIRVVYGQGRTSERPLIHWLFIINSHLLVGFFLPLNALSEAKNLLDPSQKPTFARVFSKGIHTLSQDPQQLHGGSPGQCQKGCDAGAHPV